jgi:hypothetical protein
LMSSSRLTSCSALRPSLAAPCSISGQEDFGFLSFMRVAPHVTRLSTIADRRPRGRSRCAALERARAQNRTVRFRGPCSYSPVFRQRHPTVLEILASPPNSLRGQGLGSLGQWPAWVKGFGKKKHGAAVLPNSWVHRRFGPAWFARSRGQMCARSAKV